MRAKHADRLAALDEQRLVLPQAKQHAHDRAQRFRRPRGAAAASVDDQLLRMLGDLGVKVVEQHPQRRFRLPGARIQLSATGRTDVREVAAKDLDAGVGVGELPHTPADNIAITTPTARCQISVDPYHSKVIFEATLGSGSPVRGRRCEVN